MQRQSTQKTYDYVRENLAQYYGEMYFRLVLILSQLGIPQEKIDSNIKWIFDMISTEKSEARAANYIGREIVPQIIGRPLASRAQYMAEIVSPYLKKGRLLDFGCGDGKVSFSLSSTGRAYANQVSHITLYDIETYVEKKIRDIMEFTTDWNRIKSSFAFDTTLVLTVLHHCEDIDQEMERLLQVSKRLIIIESIVSNLNPGPVMAWIDWFYNRGLHPLTDIPVPGNFKTHDEWLNIFYLYNLKLEKIIDYGVDLLVAPEHHMMYVLDNPNL